MNLVFFIVTGVITLILTLPGAAITKYLMRVLFGRVIWFWLLVLISVVSVALITMAEFLFDFGAWQSLDDFYTTTGQQELAAGFALQVAMFTLMVPDVELRFISPIKWAVVGAIVYAIWLIIIYIGLEYADLSRFELAGMPGSVRSI